MREKDECPVCGSWNIEMEEVCWCNDCGRHIPLEDADETDWDEEYEKYLERKEKLHDTKQG